MIRPAWFLSLICLCILVPSLWAWNDKGHMVIARLAWKELTPEERAKVFAILQKHPHYHQFHTEKKPDGYTEDEWAFLRAATWSDWVRNGPKEITKYHMGPVHYVNLSIIAPGYVFNAPGPAQQNVVTQLAVSKVIARNGNQEDRAVHLCWMFHLVGDVHQPLHCTTFYSPHFPKGDRGGNLAFAKTTKGSTIKLHAFWDDLFGSSTSVSSVGNGVLEAEKIYSEKHEAIDKELAMHRKYEDWVREGYEIAKKYAYLDGKLNPVTEEEKNKEGVVPILPDDYGTNAGKVARYQAVKAGKRLAAEIRDIINTK